MLDVNVLKTMTFRCAAYALFSSDKQNPASIHDQLQECREYCEKQGWAFQEPHVYFDEELSGAGAERLYALQLIQPSRYGRTRLLSQSWYGSISRLAANPGDNGLSPAPCQDTNKLISGRVQ